MPTYGSLFSGVGGLDIGLERAGWRIVWQVEKNSFRSRILAKHWPEVDRYGDIENFPPINIAHPRLIAGGFPCPVASQAARGRNVGEWLWPEFARVVRVLRPQWVLVENVSTGGAWKRWLPVVRRDLWRFGYTSLPLRLRASQFGAPFRGERIYVVAASDRDGKSISTLHEKASELQEPTGFSWTDWGNPPPRTLGMANGVSHRVDRLRAVGDAVVPQVAEWLGRQIIAVDGAK